MNQNVPYTEAQGGSIYQVPSMYVDKSVSERQQRQCVSYFFHSELSGLLQYVRAVGVAAST